MKSPNALLLSAAIVLATLLAGCGQTGPLYMPKRPAPPAPATAAPPPASAAAAAPAPAQPATPTVPAR